MMVDQKFFGEMNSLKAKRIIDKMKRNGKNPKRNGVRS
jgi:hypothetical protein